MNINETQAAGLSKMLSTPPIDEDFTSTVQDVEICVKGYYEPLDRSVGIESTSYAITHVWLPLDMQQQNIIDLLPLGVIDRLSDEGNKIISNRKIGME